jgi:hypothetical protein
VSVINLDDPVATHIAIASALGELQWSVETLNQFVAAGILVAEGTVPRPPPRTPLIAWVRQHASPEVFAAAIKRAAEMPPGERGQHLRKAIDGETDAD